MSREAGMERERREMEADKAWMAAEREALKVATAERDAAMEKLRQSVRQMKADGIGVEVIAKYTGLTADEINKPLLSVRKT